MKPFFLVSVFIFLFFPVRSQPRIGIRVAPQLTWATPDNKNVTSNGTRLNASYGLMLNYFFSENYGIGTELCFNSMGANLTLPVSKFKYIGHGSNTYYNSRDLVYDYKLQYFQVPILLKMQTKELGNMRFYAEFGFQFGFRSSSKADISSGDSLSLSNVNINEPDPEDQIAIHNTTNPSDPPSYSDKVNSTRTSLIMGAGVHYTIFGTTQLVAGIRYDNGFSSFTEDDKWSTTLNFLALNLGILF